MNGGIEREIAGRMQSQIRGWQCHFQFRRWRERQFSLKAYAEPAEQSISAGWEYLLLSAAQARDEMRASPQPKPQPIEQVPPKVQSKSTTWYRRKRQEDAIGASRRTSDEPALSIGGLFTRGVPTEDISGLARNARAAGGRPLPKAVPERRFSVEEVLVVSAQGAVLFEWQCADHAARREWVRLLEREARQAGADLALGNLDRVELCGEDWRAVASFEGEHGVFARTRHVPKTAKKVSRSPSVRSPT